MMPSPPPGGLGVWDLHGGLVSVELEASGRGSRNLFSLSAWLPGPSVPDDEGKENQYVTHLITKDGCLPHKMVSVMLTTSPGVGSRGYQSQNNTVNSWFQCEVSLVETGATEG